MTFNYGIRQIHPEKGNREAVDRLFTGHDTTIELFGSVDLSFYESADSGIIGGVSPEEACENLFIAYNADERPHGYRGRSMSVSDVVILRDDAGEESIWFCDLFGFRKLEGVNVCTP